jgi:hypothetical protein
VRDDGGGNSTAGDVNGAGAGATPDLASGTADVIGQTAGDAR